MNRFKNYKKTSVRVACLETGRTCVFGPHEERELGDEWTDLVLSKGIVPLDEVDRRVVGEAEEAAALEAQAVADAESDAQNAEARAAALARANEAAAQEELRAKRSAAAKKAAATRAAKKL